jgi:hypothetical protein
MRSPTLPIGAPLPEPDAIVLVVDDEVSVERRWVA